MNLYIETENGVIKNHPAFEDNLLAAFGTIPSHWEPFNRVERPIPSVYQLMDSEEPIYSKVNNVWTDVWSLRDMSLEEKTAKQQGVRDAWASRTQAENWNTWVFNEATCQMEPPIPAPELDPAKIEAGIYSMWCGAENNWKDSPPYPVDSNSYKFDHLAWQWIQIVNLVA